MVTVLGHGVVEGKEGHYYFKTGYTLRQLLTDGTVELIKYPARVIRIQRESDKKKIISVDRKKLIEDPNIDGFTLKEGDIIYITEPFL
ncbi:hypothetical protein DDZ13_13045 [Coraliomargarita sinensis]|uniref:Soluble ligand binding domain-containing protein n=2 Tax=Coraliomargarita sinensis TaxID=2174842 RepID=A0A317ZGJ5_9BACT|nr:hypothetical protein DDZ13_13045 [Coraliomargarita sinensis]